MTKKIIGPAVLYAVAAVVVVATPADAKRDKEVWQAARMSGPPVNCLQVTDIRETRVRSDSVIDFYTRSRKVYRNVLPNGCPGLNTDRAFTYQTSISRLCSVDIITVLYQTPGLQRGASCGLGAFQPIEGAPK